MWIGSSRETQRVVSPVWLANLLASGRPICIERDENARAWA